MSVVKKCFKLLQLRQHFDWIPEREVIAYLRSWNRNLKTDEYGNLYLINPDTPLLCAHMDTVQREDSVNNLHTLRLNNWVIKAKDAVIWGDDKCGIAIAMEIYEKMWDKVSLLFTRQEETGCNWAREFCNNHKDLVEQCNYCLVLDRRWWWDIIGYSNQYCSKEFENEIARLTKEFWYKPTTGLSSDTGQIAKIINWVNLSVGYYNPHTKNEYVNCNELINAYEAVTYIIQNLQWEYPIYEFPKFWLYNNPLADDDDDEYDYWNRSFWCWYSTYKKSKRWKKKDTFKETDLSDYFYVEPGWLLRVKKDIFLTNIADDTEWAELSKGEYMVCEYA